jgi:hypothetical protein
VTRPHGAYFDLTECDGPRAEALCNALAATRMAVLHGSNTPSPLPRVDPRKANDASKAAGNRLAVYATTEVRVALLNALLNRALLSRLFSSYVIGYRVVAGEVILRATDNVFALLTERNPSPWADGFVYLLDRRRFTEVAAGASEFTCPTSVIPLATLKVGAALGEQLFTFGTDAGGDTAVPYSPEERDRLAAHLLRII